MAMVGDGIKLGFGGKGELIVTDKALRKGISPFLSSSDFVINAPLAGLVTVEIKVPLGGVELTIPPEQVKVVLGTQELNKAQVVAVRDALQRLEHRLEVRG